MSPGPLVDEARLRRLLDVGRGLVAEHDVDAILDQVLVVARELTGARYAALGVLDEAGRELERFITAGIDEETQRTIGDLPRGRGVLGVLIDEPHTLRLDDVGSHPRSYGFPPGHPPMRTFLGVPIRIRGKAYGNLYLTEKDDGSFTELDEEVIAVLADWAAIAVDNARAHEREQRRSGELETALETLEATTDISRALGGETDHDRVLELIVKRARALVRARVLLILLLDESGHTLVVSALAGEGDPAMLGERVPVAGSTSGDVLMSQRAQRLSDVSRRRHFALGESLGARTALFMPLAYRGRGLGVLCAYDRDGELEFSAADERLLQGFATSAAIAVATAQRFAEQGLRRSIEAAERERTRWARELHDETLQELAGLRVLLSAARRSPQDAAGALDDAVEQIELTITGLRHLITELRPAALDTFGLGAAIEALVERVEGASGLDIATEVDLGDDEDGRLEPDSESTLYRLVQEALTNIVRHAAAENVHIVVRMDGDDVLLEIHDDGRGFDPSERHDGFGLVGMRERVELAGGTLQIRSGAGEGSILTARVPGRRRV